VAELVEAPWSGSKQAVASLRAYFNAKKAQASLAFLFFSSALLVLIIK
jgi:hypothetical protein